VFYRDLTTIDLRQLGLSCVRVLSPDLTPIHCDQRYPFLGGRTADVLWRYPWARGLSLTYPNPLPHPLG
jgi:ribosomal protein S12 methylthiotransferase accessory factor